MKLICFESGKKNFILFYFSMTACFATIVHVIVEKVIWLSIIKIEFGLMKKYQIDRVDLIYITNEKDFSYIWILK